MTAGHGLVEKVRPLPVRGKPRDLYDIWLLLNQSVSPDRALTGRKLKFYQATFSAQKLEAATARVGPAGNTTLLATFLSTLCKILLPPDRPVLVDQASRP